MDSNASTPAIVISTIDDGITVWKEVLLGIEEEGIPFVIQTQTDGDVTHCAWQAARRSPLLVGIACDKEKLVVHYKNLPGISAAFYADVSPGRHARRSAGNNAAKV